MRSATYQIQIERYYWSAFFFSPRQHMKAVRLEYKNRRQEKLLLIFSDLYITKICLFTSTRLVNMYIFRNWRSRHIWAKKCISTRKNSLVLGELSDNNLQSLCLFTSTRLANRFSIYLRMHKCHDPSLVSQENIYYYITITWQVKHPYLKSTQYKKLAPNALWFSN